MNDKGKNTTVVVELPSGSRTPLETTTEAEQSTTYSRQKISNDWNDHGQENYVGSFNKLIQVGTIDEYFEHFEELQARSYGE
ncbi:hypothetical protein IFM89_016460 [Coptis chinensis]|uniref:Uncharacterized protein n=1 Tax=Coptis chinensis TaxID=261450 RepID=A0A835M3K5_9MAGN|nr:hypothetical protein IFM89_016460 [Coptis chinensis]